MKIWCAALFLGAATVSLWAQAPVKRTIGEMTIHTGSPSIPVILVQFSDKQMSGDSPNADYTARLSEAATQAEVEAGEGTARQYFSDQSNGRFIPDFVVIGPVTLPHPEAYYGADGMVDKDENVGAMLVDAITAAIASGAVKDWSMFDNDGNGTVDALYVIYAGEGQHAFPGQTDLIWPHTATLADRSLDSPVADGVRFNSYSCTNELLNGKPDGIGTFCHEFSHQLGLPDFYRTDGNGKATEFAMGSWSLMDFGSYAMDGRRPVGLRALEKIALGWTEPVVLDAAVTVEGWASMATGAQPFKIVNNITDAEYYLLEVIDGKGWDMSCPAGGLLVTHVYLPGTDAWNSNTVNNSSPYRVQIIPADNEKPMLVTGVNEEEYAENLKGDTYPSPSGNNELTDTSVPAATVQAGLWGKMNKPVTNIVYDASTGRVSFDFMGGSTEQVLTGISHVHGAVGAAAISFFRLDGTPVSEPLRPGVYLRRDADGRVEKFLKK